MAFEVQDDEGEVEGANAYIDAEFFVQYFQDRGNEDASELDDEEIEPLIVQATTYVDAVFKFKGAKLAGDEQTTEFPRTVFSGIPLKFKQAIAEYAWRASQLADSGGLAPDPTRDASGMRVSGFKKKIGPLEKEVTYEAGSASSLSSYPLADRMLSEYLAAAGGFSVIRV